MLGTRGDIISAEAFRTSEGSMETVAPAALMKSRRLSLFILCPFPNNGIRRGTPSLLLSGYFFHK